MVEQKQPIKVALVGFGISGQCFQAPIITKCPQFELMAVVSSDEEKVKAQLPWAKVYSEFEQMLQNSDIELVVIATPNHLHVPQAKAALLAGKHVVVEKPFSISVEEGQTLLDVQKQTGKVLTVYQSRRFDGDFITIKKLIDDKRLAGVHTFYSSYNRYRPEVKVRWREQDVPGAGILYDLGAHLIDQALALFGLPDKVTAVLKNQRKGAQAVDHFHLILHYPDKEAILHANCQSTAEGPRFQVFSERGTFIKYGMDVQEDFLRERKSFDSQGWGEDPQAMFGIYTDADQNQTTVPTELGGYQGFYFQLADAIQHGAPVPVCAQEALNVIQVIEAAYLSAKQERTIKIKELS
ncbi:oxidoreductase [Vibrio sp. SCSIO 43136]|uniref:oxidoreductase n=1 Tax=Vibrio sp. SCSIO 43136 TaxID=2819101 RepID=UPI0020766438|nr:oxidoreductase [Vibrio sp. SCSIO 43136]USD67221.1 oxidoreductase [Vibrio sp. SCSIO 43136]